MSQTVTKYTQGLTGIEIGAGAHNDFGFDKSLVKNIDKFFPSDNNPFTNSQVELCGRVATVDIIADGNVLPFEDNSLDFVFSSHVIEHFYDTIGTLEEWERVVKPGGYIIFICPHQHRTFEKDRPSTTLQELFIRYDQPDKLNKPDKHWWTGTTVTMVEVLLFMNFNIVCVMDKDDQVGNGFLIVIEVNK